MTPREVVLAFWRAMETNDFHHAAGWLTPDYEGHWPQSGEVIRGPANFAAINTAYPASGRWRFRVNRCLAEGTDIVTDVTVTDGAIIATAVSFHKVQGDRIARQTEYWPDPFDAPAWRAEWVERRQEMPQ